MAKRKRLLLLISIIAFCFMMLVMCYKLLVKPSNVDLCPAINEAFLYYRSGSIGNPAAYIYFMEFPEKSVTYEPLPEGLAIPNEITSDSFTLKRPSKDIVACIPFDGYTAYCTLEYLGPHFMEWYPPPAWQVVAVKFVANK